MSISKKILECPKLKANSSPLTEQQALLTTEPSLHPPAHCTLNAHYLAYLCNRPIFMSTLLSKLSASYDLQVCQNHINVNGKNKPLKIIVDS